MRELWKNVTGYKNLYKVSNLGRIKSLDRLTTGKNNTPRKVRGKILKSYLDYSGYEKISLSNYKGLKKNLFVHRLVAREFCKGYKKGLVVNHIDSNRTNNCCKNLEWVTIKTNNLKSIEKNGPRFPKGPKYIYSCIPKTCKCKCKFIEGFDKFYQISECGLVKSFKSFRKNGRIKIPRILEGTYSGGYLGVTLTKNGKSKIYFIHRLVAQAFIKNPGNKPCVNHKDGDKFNNCKKIWSG